MEDYLEAIYALSQQKKTVRVKDIAKRLGVKMPTVTSMLNTLSEKGLVDYKKYEYVEPTQEGADLGSEIDHRHKTLKIFLTNILQISNAQADDDACRMEHAVSPLTLERMVEFMRFVEECPRVGHEWLERFNDFRVHGALPDRDKCRERMKQFITEYSDKPKKPERKA
jgi:DtxR family Mn-dependent transcriptional regulator